MFVFLFKPLYSLKKSQPNHINLYMAFLHQCKLKAIYRKCMWEREAETDKDLQLKSRSHLLGCQHPGGTWQSPTITFDVQMI